MGSNERVAAGAQWLDSVAPGWERKIDLSTLDISDECLCVCGQVKPFGTYLDQGDVVPSGFAAVERWVVQHHHKDWWWWLSGHGFTYSEDLDAWVALIKERFDTGTLSDENPPSPFPEPFDMDGDR